VAGIEADRAADPLVLSRGGAGVRGAVGGVAVMRGDFRDESRRFEDIDRAAQAEAEKRLRCGCSRCIAPLDCPGCQACGGLCKACEDHYAALADAYESNAALSRPGAGKEVR
jgi:hypothetical protein